MINFLKGILEKSRFSRNTTPKIISILFALVLWLYVMGEVNPETNKVFNNLEVQLLNVEELRKSGLVIIDQEDFTVDVKITGRTNELYKISQEDIKVSADLRGFQQGINSIPLEISSPANITIEDIQPKQIKVRLDKVVKRQKPVTIKINGDPSTGFEVGELNITPTEILVEGPQTKVNDVAEVIGEINVDGKSENIRNNVPIKAVDSEGKEIAGVEVETKYVNTYLPILKIKNVELIPQIQGSVKEGYKITNIEVSPNNVLLKGKTEDLNDIVEISTEIVNIDGIESDLVTEVNPIVPDNITTPRLYELPKLKVEVEKIESKEFTFNTTEISINNLDNDLSTNIGHLRGEVKVRISDVRSILEEIKRSDLELVINAENIKEEGSYEATIEINKDMAFENIEIFPNNIQIDVYRKDSGERVDMIPIEKPINDVEGIMNNN